MFRRCVVIVCSLLIYSVAAVAAELAQVPVPELRAPVTDLTQTLTPDQIQILDRQLRGFSERTGSQLAILIVPTTQPETIEQYSIRVVETWQLGRKKEDDGVLLLVAKQDHSARIEVGYGLEGVLTDATTHRIIRQVMLPNFKAGRFFEGLTEASTRLMQLINGEVSPEQVSAPEADRRGRELPWPLLIFIAIVGGGLARVWFGRVAAAVMTAGLIGLITWLFMGSLLITLLAICFAFLFVLGGRGHGWGSGGWASGGGGWRGGSGGFGGGFSGGGGGFGGGGASGRW